MMNVWPTSLESNLLGKPITGPNADAPPEEIEAAFNAISSAQSEAIQAGLNPRECLFPNNDEIRLEESKESEDDTATSSNDDVLQEISQKKFEKISMNSSLSSSMDKISRRNY